MNGIRMWLKKIKKHLGILPSLVFMLIMFWAGILNSIKAMFNFNLLREIVFSREFIVSTKYTLRLSLFSILSVAFVSIIGIFILYLLSINLSEEKLKKIRVLTLFPMYIPYILAGYMFSLILSQSGIISTIVYKLGFIENLSEFPALVNEPRGYSIIFTYAWKASPFIILMVFPNILRINKDWMDVARVFGVGKFYFFRKIVFPLIMPLYISSLFIVFAHILSSFEVPYLLGVTYPRTLSVLAYEKYARNSVSNREVVLVMNGIIIFITTLIGMIIYYSNKSLREGTELELEK